MIVLKNHNLETNLIIKNQRIDEIQKCSDFGTKLWCEFGKVEYIKV